MAFVTTGEMLKKAQAGGYAIGAFNAENLEMVQAIIAAAEVENAPVRRYRLRCIWTTGTAMNWRRNAREKDTPR